MPSHPDADALMRGVLDHLHDRVSRLVFADWLDETGSPSNAAWARYIRLTHADAPPDPGELAHAAAGIRARLTLHTRFFLNHRRDLTDLLPPANIRVRLAEFHPPRRMIEAVPESVVREDQVLVLDEELTPNPRPAGNPPGRLLVFAAADLRNTDTPEKLAFILNATIQLVGADPADVSQAISRVYGDREVESVDEFLVEFADLDRAGIERRTDSGRLIDVTDDDHPITRLARLILTEALDLHATAVQVRPTKGGARVTYLIDGRLTDRDAIPAPIFPHLADRFRLMGGLDPDGSRGPVEWGRILLPHRGRDRAFLLEITELAAGPDIFIQLDEAAG